VDVVTCGVSYYFGVFDYGPMTAHR
jgi:hypothetical protein